MILRFFTIFSFLFFTFSCNNSESNSTSTEQKTAPPATETIKAQGKVIYPSIPFETIKALYEKCDYVDYSFERLPFTINRQEPNDVRHSLAQIAQEPALINDSCPPFGRMVYYKDGNIALEALIYFSKGCTYYVFLEDNQPKYANFMTPSGVNFFNDLATKIGQQQ